MLGKGGYGRVAENRLMMLTEQGPRGLRDRTSAIKGQGPPLGNLMISDIISQMSKLGVLMT